MSIFTNLPIPARLLLGRHRRQDNVKMYMKAKFDQNRPCGSRVMRIFTN